MKIFKKAEALIRETEVRKVVKIQRFWGDRIMCQFDTQQTTPKQMQPQRVHITESETRQFNKFTIQMK